MEMPSRSWYDSFFLLVIPPLAALLIKLLMLSCRLGQTKGQDREADALSRYGGAIYPTWHQRMSYLAHFLGSRHVTAMISQSRDGEYAARIAQWLGFSNIRGSTSRGGTEALRAIIRTIKKGHNGGMLADGPRGPAGRVKAGIIAMARATRAAIVPFYVTPERAWYARSWDRFFVPKPFSRVVLRFDDMIELDVTEEFEQQRLALERRMRSQAGYDADDS